ncbi:MAG TPA: hypothetical protein PKO30_07495 [Prolixibacteraceae bacterium]|nr:hypothetical protein [Prolixibacteraceae bacterium]
MSHFTEVNFETALKFFEEAEVGGNRMRIGDFSTSKWLQKKNLNLDELIEFSKNLPDSKIVLIGEGPFEGFYIYSLKKKTCFKFEPGTQND